MSRQSIPMRDGSLLVIGYDRACASWFALHYDDHDENAPPRVAIGYSPDEQAILRGERADAVVATEFPIADPERLCRDLVPQYTGIAVSPDQPMCAYCGKPPWRSNSECVCHPYDRLREAT